MDIYNVKKRQVMSFDEFVNTAKKKPVEKVEKGEHEMVTKSTDKLVSDKKGVETLDENETAEETSDKEETEEGNEETN